MRTVERTIAVPFSHQPAHKSAAVRHEPEGDDALLRRWTPVLLRATLSVAAVLMIAGMIAGRMHNVSTSSDPIWRAAALHHDPAALATLGLMALTLVPLIRVAFCLLLFVRQRNLLYVAMTGYVLAVLTAGIVLGRIG